MNNKVPLQIKYVEFTATHKPGANANSNMSWDTLKAKIPKGYLPVGIVYFYSGSVSVMTRGVMPYYKGQYINSDIISDENWLMLMRNATDTALSSNATVHLTFACIPVEYLDTHLCEYEFWDTNT